jgi:F-type H+-transporting ATPase subunit delta
MSNRKNFGTTARKLAALSFDAAGAASVERVRGILDTLAASRPAGELRPLLKSYYLALRRELAAREVVVEHAGPLAPDVAALVAAFYSQRYGRPVAPRLIEAPELLAGIRTKIGDDVFDASAAGILDRLRR